MKRKLYGFITLALLFSLPLSALATSHEKMDMDHGKMEKMDHGSMKGMDHGKMMEDGMAMLGERIEDSVKAIAHINDVGDAMAEMGMKETHHLMVNFVDVETGSPIETGVVAVKVKGPSGTEGKPIRLMGMEGHFGADIVLNEKGKYEFEVGSKLKDGTKRQYKFEYTVK